MLICTMTWAVKAGQEQEFERIMRLVVPKVREEPGTHAYVCHRATQDPRVFMVYAQYADRAALEAHWAHLRALGLELDAWLDATPVVVCYDQLA